MNIFFDGVPEKEKIVTESIKEEAKEALSKPVIQEKIQSSTHPDYKNRSCDKCHNKNSINFLVTDKKKLCFICHKEEKFIDSYVHGPVAAKACYTCHKPHSSNYPYLLLEIDRKLCDQCHKKPTTNNLLSCKGDKCLKCHSPHISDNKFFLLENADTEYVDLNSNHKLLINTDGKRTDDKYAKANIPVKKKLDIRFKLRSADHKNFTRVVIELEIPEKFTKTIQDDMLKINFIGVKKLKNTNKSGNLSRFFINFGIDGSLITMRFKKKFKIINELLLENPFRIVLDLVEKK